MIFTTVYLSLNSADAQLVCSRLEASGFHPVVRNELSSFSIEGYALAAGGLRIEVPESEAEDARLLIKSSQSDSPSSEEPTA